MEIKKKSVFDKIIELIKSQKGMQTVIIVVVLLAVVLLYISTLDFGKNNTGESSKSQATPKVTEDTLEARLGEVLSSINGAGKVKVILAYNNSGEDVLAKDEEQHYQESTNNTSGNPVTDKKTDYTSKVTIIQGDQGQSPVVVERMAPEIRGVIVVAQGAGNPAVKEQLLRAVQTLLNISSYQIDIFEMAKSK